MKKSFRRIGKSPLSIDNWSLENYPLPSIREWFYSKHLRRRATSKDKDGTVVVEIGSGWYALCYRNGIRLLSVLPF